MVFIATKEHAYEIANLHDLGLDQSFLRKLGVPFLTSMYRFFIKNELVFVFLEEAKVKGFISASLSTNKVMRKFIISSPVGVLQIVIALFKKPALVKSIYETYSSSHKTTLNQFNNLPSVELLSIVVSNNAQQSGIGYQLLIALESELKRLGIKQYKVVAGEKLVGANRFYLKNGFEIVNQITIHGDDVSNVYVKTL